MPGVDFGTATTLVADPTIVALGRTTNGFPSDVYLDGTALRAGEDAATVDPRRVLRSVKRAITDRRETFDVDGRAVDADDAIATVLREAVARAAAAGSSLGDGSAIRLGCPAMWDGEQRRRLLGIAHAAGLAVGERDLVDEPVAAGVAWLSHRFLGHGERPTGRLLVFDMGGGTVDVAVLFVTGGPTPEIAVRASLGTSLAGDALDVAIANDLAAELVRLDPDPARLPEPDVVWAMLDRAAREAKVRLSSVDDHPLVLPHSWGLPSVLRYRREQLEAAFATGMDAAETLVLSALRAARLAEAPATAAELRALDRDELVDGVDHLLLVGGMSRIPYVARRLSALLPRARRCDTDGLPPEEAVVTGLADPVGFDRVRLPRPSFSVALDTAYGRAVLYEAYTPLFEPWQVYSGESALGYERWLRPPELPAHGYATLRPVTVSGDPVRLRLDGQAVDGIPVRLGPGGVAIALTCDGRLGVVDGHGEASAYQSDGWPAAGAEALVVRHL